MADDDEKLGVRNDVKGWLAIGGFGLLWTVVAGGMFTFITLASLGLIGQGNDTSSPNLAMYGLMVAMFLPGPAALFIGASELVTVLRDQARRRAFPQQPWKWTSQWTGGVVLAGAAGEAFWAWYGATTLALFLGPFVLQLAVVKPDARVLILLPFVALNLFLFRFAWRRSRSARRYGKLRLRLSQLPLQPGVGFEVLLEIPASLEGDAKLNLSCQRTTHTRRHESRTEIVFESSTKVPIVSSGPLSIVRGHVELPAQRGEELSWSLAIEGEGLDELFALPVFEATEIERFPV